MAVQGLNGYNRLGMIHKNIKRTPLRKLIVLSIFSRALVFLAAVAAASIFGERPCTDCWDIGVPFLNLFSRWDSGHYTDIAMHGYSKVIVPNWDFFPGYPILMALLGRLLAASTQMQLLVAINLTGFVVSNLAFLGAIYFFYKLSFKLLHNPDTAYNSALYLAICPAGVFLSAVYSESLFLMLTIGSLYYWQLGSLGKSSVLGFFSAITRPVGIILAIPYLYRALSSKRRYLAKSYLPVASILLGYLIFMAYSQLMTGTPFANFAAEYLYWGVSLNPISKMVLAYEELLANPIILPYIVLSIFAIAASILSIKSRGEAAIVLYAVCLLIIYLLNPIDSFPRYSITLLPIYWSLSRWSKSLVVKRFMIAFLVALLVIGTGLFVNWYSFY